MNSLSTNALRKGNVYSEIYDFDTILTQGFHTIGNIRQAANAPKLSSEDGGGILLVFKQPYGYLSQILITIRGMDYRLSFDYEGKTFRSWIIIKSS